MSTTITAADVVEAGKGSSLTQAVLTEWAAKGTPKQREYLHGLLMDEHASRRQARQHRLLKAAKLPAVKTFTGYDWSQITFPDDYGRDQLMNLEFLEAGGDLVFYGDVGTGKTHLGCALVAEACQQGIPAKFFTTAGLVAQLRRAQQAERLEKELASLAKNRLLAIDELGYLPFDADAANLFFQLVASRYEQGSLLITSNLSFGRWGEIFADDTIAAAMIDRLVHHAEVLTLDGESYRTRTRREFLETTNTTTP